MGGEKGRPIDVSVDNVAAIFHETTGQNEGSKWLKKALPHLVFYLYAYVVAHPFFLIVGLFNSTSFTFFFFL